ncbi:MAG: hypothetical protein GC189_09920 [Alphaproteobacteria bacterium]|nr:hypothetical protein [Alphaproteobacteria bacterium]
MSSLTLPRTDKARHAAAEQWDLWALAAASCIIAAAPLFYGRAAFPHDDAFITMHNAEALLRGEDRAFPGVSPLIGATSLAHLWIVAQLQGLFGAGYASSIAGAGACIAYALGVRAIALRVGLSKIEALALALAGMITGYGLYHLANGLETGLAMAAVAWALYSAIDAYPNRWTPMACGLLPFVRPELALLSAALMARQIYLRWSVDPLVTILQDIAIAAACATPFLWWSLSETGALMPQTIGAKAAFFASPTSPWMQAPRAVLALLACGFGALWFGAYGLRGSSVGIAALAFMVAFALAFALTEADALFHNNARYAAVLAPALALGVAFEIARRTGPHRLALLAILCAWGVGSAAFIGAPGLVRDLGRGLESATFIARRTPEGAALLAHDIGRPAALTSARVVDLVGLKTPQAHAVHQRLTRPSEGAARGAAMAEIAATFQPLYAEIRTGDPFWAQSAEALRAAGWRLTPLFADSRGDYTVFALQPPQQGAEP